MSFNPLDPFNDEDFEFEAFEERMPMRKSYKVRKMRGEEEMTEQSDELEKQADIDAMLDDIFEESEEESDEVEEVVYEIELDEEDDTNEDMMEEAEETDEEMNETYDLEEAFKPKMFKGKNPESKSNKGPKKMSMKKPTGKMFGMTPKMGKATKTSGSNVNDNGDFNVINPLRSNATAYLRLLPATTKRGSSSSYIANVNPLYTLPSTGPNNPKLPLFASKLDISSGVKLLSIAWWNWEEYKIKENAMTMWSNNINEFIEKFYGN